MHNLSAVGMLHFLINIACTHVFSARLGQVLYIFGKTVGKKEFMKRIMHQNVWC